MTNTELTIKLEQAKWTYAKTMPQTPHYYTLRKNMKDKDFVDIVLKIREIGIKETFGKYTYVYFYANGFKYWTMGASINKDGKPHTTLINKADANYITQYDDIAEAYDLMFQEPEFENEDIELIKLLGIEETDEILDIGCGTGLLLDHTDIEIDNYVGIDKSKKMLRAFDKKHPHHQIVNASVQDFYTERKFDKVVALFGVGSYLTDEEIEKAVSLTKPNGKFYIMIYKDNYVPITYKKGQIKCSHYPHEKNGFNAIDFNNYIIYTNKGI